MLGASAGKTKHPIHRLNDSSQAKCGSKHHCIRQCSAQLMGPGLPQLGVERAQAVKLEDRVSPTIPSCGQKSFTYSLMRLQSPALTDRSPLHPVKKTEAKMYLSRSHLLPIILTFECIASFAGPRLARLFAATCPVDFAKHVFGKFWKMLV